MDDPYRILGLEKGASLDEVKKTYKTLAKKYHPDVAGSDPVSQRIMEEINEAYNQIINGEATFSSSSQSQRSAYTDSSQYMDKIKTATAYINSRRFSEALSTLSQIPTNGRSSRWYYLSSYSKAALGDTEAAVADIDTAIRMEPQNITYQAFRRKLTGQRFTYTSQMNNYNRNAGISPCCMAAYICFLCNMFS